MVQKRHRGGQPNNQNAVKHGYYSRELNKAERLEFDLAAGMDGIEEEIALLRYKIKKAVISGEIADLIPLSKIIYALEKLIRTNHKIFGSSQKNWENAFRTIFRDLIGPDGDTHILRVMAHDKFPDEFPPVRETNQNEKTEIALNEAESS
jgi:hypothetical protein